MVYPVRPTSPNPHHHRDLPSLLLWPFCLSLAATLPHHDGVSSLSFHKPRETFSSLSAFGHGVCHVHGFITASETRTPNASTDITFWGERGDMWTTSVCCLFKNFVRFITLRQFLFVLSSFTNTRLWTCYFFIFIVNSLWAALMHSKGCESNLIFRMRTQLSLNYTSVLFWLTKIKTWLHPQAFH